MLGGLQKSAQEECSSLLQTAASISINKLPGADGVASRMLRTDSLLAFRPKPRNPERGIKGQKPLVLRPLWSVGVHLKQLYDREWAQTPCIGIGAARTLQAAQADGSLADPLRDPPDLEDSPAGLQ